MKGCADTAMKHLKTFACIGLLLFIPAHTFAEIQNDRVNFHLTFENFNFLQEDIVSRSGFKTIEDRGLTLEEGRFGKGLRMNLTPSVDDQDDMTGTDLDTVTAVVFNTRHRRDIWVGYNEPFLWGAGKLNPGSGSVAFWVKGRIKEGDLFTQSAMAWGRKERFLIAVTVDEFGQLGAYLRDARYTDHTVKSNAAWDDGAWNHIVLNWDKARGIELFLNGQSAASSWGADSWWETPLPGLLHLPMPEVVYDELYIFSEPLTPQEITSLMNTNSVPESISAVPERTPEDRNRLAKAIGLSTDISLPVITPMASPEALSFREITPGFMGDGHVPARFCQDGRYELAWPHPVAVFTIIPGDVDFQAEKLDIDIPPGERYNYITVEGNLNGLPAVIYDSRKDGDRFTGEMYFEIPQDGRFFYGAVVDEAPCRRITLPFLKGYGAPGEFSGDVRLPLTGETRVHEVGIFNVTPVQEKPSPGEVYYLRKGGSPAYRYEFAMKSLNPRSDRTAFYGYRTVPQGKNEWVGTGFLRRMHFITAPMTGEKYVGQIVLDIDIKTEQQEDVLLVRLHDPGVPHRIWTHAEMKLKGFHGDGGRLRLMLDPPPLFLAQDDVIWIDIATLNGAKINIGGSDTGRIILKQAQYNESVQAYEMKALMPVMAEYTRAYHHQPWLFENIWPDIMNPHTFGGQFDSVMPAMAVQRALPHSRLAEYYVDWAKPKYHWGSFVDAEKNFPIKDIEVPESVPRWAFLQHRIQNFRYRIIDWLTANQNQDGQFGGGWNDDTLILRGKLDIPLDSCDRARDIFLKVYEGLDRTQIFGDGYCRIHPIDRLHNGDFVRERYRALIYKPGDPFIVRRALQTAWHWDKPESTPINYGGGKPFLFDKNILEWYWGSNVPVKAYRTASEDVIDTNLSRLASYCDDILYHRYTEARIHTDSQTIYNERYITRMILGGSADASISAAWTEGGGEDLARWVTYADSVKFECRMFSFDPLQRKVTARLCRIQPGTYEIKLSKDSGGVPGMVLYTMDKKMKRFDTFSFYVPSKTPVLLTVRQIKKDKNPGPYPDLALAVYGCERRGSTLRVRVSNLGAVPSKKSSVRIYNDKGKKIAEEKIPVIEAPVDFTEKSVYVEFDGLPEEGTVRVVVDPRNKLDEILEENNEIKCKL